MAIPTVTQTGQESPSTTRRPLRVGIVGFGLRSSLWRQAHHPDAGSTVTIVCDVSERGRADARAALPSAEVTDDLDRLLGSGIDAVLVLTPDHVHLPVALAALTAGVPVFCEKPMATTIEDCDAILQAAQQTGTRLYVGHNMRHMPVVTQLRQIIRSGRIGNVKTVWCRHFVGHGGDFYFKDWHADRRNSTGLLLQKGAHDLDVIHWLAGGFAERVSAMGDLAVYGAITDRRDRTGERMTDWYSLDNWPPTTQTGLNPVVDVEDISMMQLRLDNGVLASYQQCHFAPDYWRNYTVIGDAGRVENFGDRPGDRIGIWDRRHDGSAAPDETVTIAGDAEGHGGADQLMMDEFLRFVRDGGATDTSPVAARQAVAAALTATESLRGTSSALDIPALDPAVVDYFAAGQHR
ncbi:MAG: Gfo/Idh/MocA family oxidoreductase [Propionibacteriaceae bacterium]